MLQNARKPESQHSGGCRTDELNTERSAQSRAANTDILLSRCRKTLELLSGMSSRERWLPCAGNRPISDFALAEDNRIDLDTLNDGAGMFGEVK